jgi:hypothetical protein
MRSVLYRETHRDGASGERDSLPAGADVLFLLRPGRRPAPFSVARTLVDVEAVSRPVLSADGDPLASGCAVELGYFTRASLQRPFAGDWVPLTGPMAHRRNRTLPLARVGTHGAARGCFRWCCAFYRKSNQLPTGGTPLALRFYDAASPGAARHFNTAAHPSWWFRSPGGLEPSDVELNLADDAVWESGPAGAFRTSRPSRGVVSRFFALVGRHVAALCA